MPICKHLKPVAECKECNWTMGPIEQSWTNLASKPQPKKKPVLTQAIVDKVAATLTKPVKAIKRKVTKAPSKPKARKVVKKVALKPPQRTKRRYYRAP